ncbi:MAG: hypothetical protein NW226_00975 [Microscillaceae bacterium]|nr:hypothetical protein [Microscillaceae bacterium]
MTLFLAGFMLNSCQTIRELKAFAKSEFRIKEINTLNLGEIDLLRINSFSDLNLSDAAKLGLAFKSGALPLNITFNIEVRNPNDQLAAMEKLDWILEVDQTDFVNGTTNERVEVPANGGLANFPISTSFDVRKALNKESINSLVNLVAAIKGDNMEQSRIRLKVKPRFKIAGITMAYPGFIKLGKTFESSKEVE